MTLPLAPPAVPEDRRARPQSLVSVEFNELLAELSSLLEVAATPEEFFGPFLETVMELTGATGVVVWQRNSAGQLQIQREFNFGALNLEATPNGLASHQLLVEEATLSRRSQWVPPVVADPTAKLIKGNYSTSALILAPIQLDDKLAGLLEVFVTPDHERQNKRFLTRLTAELAGFVGTFWQQRQWRQQQDQQQIWQQLEAFAAEVHRSLDARQVAYLTVNDGKRLVECDQLAMARWRDSEAEVLAISGAVQPEPGSPVVQALTQLAAALGAWGEPLVYSGTPDDALPSGVRTALDAYLALSNSRVLIALPLIDPRPSIHPTVGVLLAESFDAMQPHQLRARLEFMVRHVAPAFSNALALQRLPLQWLTRPLAQLQDGMQARSRVRLGIFAGVMILFAALLILAPLPLRPEVSGRLVPQERRVVYSTLTGKILQLAVKHGDHVEKGQELLFIEDLDTQLKVDQLSVKISSLGQKLNIIEEQLTKPLSVRDRAEQMNERMRAQYDLGKAKVERNLLLAENRNPRKSALTAPLAAQVLTFDAKEKLLGKTVKAGDPLLRLASTQGRWEVELFIGERDAGVLRDALHQSSDGTLDVDVLITSDPHRVYKAKLERDSLGGEAVIQNDKIVLPALATIADPVLLGQVTRMPVGVEVHARVHCGYASAGYVLFGEVWSFVYEKFLF